MKLSILKFMPVFIFVILLASIANAATINSVVTVPATVVFGNSVTISADVSDADNVSFVVNSPTGVVVDSPSASGSGNVYISDAFTVDEHGDWSYVVTASENGTDVTFNGDFTIVNSNPVITSSAVTVAYLDEDYSYTVTATDVDGDNLTFSVTGPAGMTIDSAGLITWTPVQGSYDVNVTVDDGNGNTDNQSFTLTAKEREQLAIDELEVRVDGDKDTVDDGDKIRDEARPGSDVSFEFNLENLNDRSDKDGDLRDVEIIVTIYDIDDGDDLEEDSGTFDIDAGKDEKVTLDFRLPDKVNEDDYTVEIEIEGETEDGEIVRIQWELTLEVEKDSHDIVFTELSLSPSEVSCSRSSGIDINVLNIGSSDEDEMVLTIKNNNLGLNIRETFEVEEGDDEDSEWDKFVSLKISDELESGTYPIYVNLYYDDTKLVESETLQLVVRDCTINSDSSDDSDSDSASQEEEDAGVEIVYTDDVVDAYAPVTAEETKDNSFYRVLLLIAGNLLVLIIVIILLALLLPKK